MRTGQGDDSAALSVCHFLESSRRAPLRDRAEACASDTLNADYVSLYTAPLEFRGSGLIYFVDIMNVGFVFGSSRTRMFSLISPHRELSGGLLFWSYGNRGINQPAM